MKQRCGEALCWLIVVAVAVQSLPIRSSSPRRMGALAKSGSQHEHYSLGVFYVSILNWRIRKLGAWPDRSCFRNSETIN